jgi:uncharacterized UPF0160 family protein
MGYRLIATRFRRQTDKPPHIANTFQEYLLRDFESQRSLIASKDLASKKIYTYESDSHFESSLPHSSSKNPSNHNGGDLEESLRQTGIKIDPIKKEVVIATHSPPFHADDLMACVLMAKYYEKKEQPYSLIFTRDQKVIDQADVVIDVGGSYQEDKLRFDHHQLKDSNKAATGLVAQFLQEQMGLKWAKHLMPTLEKIDKADLGKANTVNDLKISELLSNFNPTWEEKPNDQFYEAFQIIKDCLDKSLEKIEANPSLDLSEIFERELLKNPIVKIRENQVQAAKKKGDEMFLAAAIDGKESGIAVTQQGIDFYSLFSQSYLDSCPKDHSKAINSINYIKFNTPTGANNAIAAPKPNNRMEQKHPFPEAWKGKRGQELVDQINKSTGGGFPPVSQEKANEYFCHGAGFFLTAPDINVFNAALNHCARIAKEKDIPDKMEQLKNNEKWGRGGPMFDHI